LDAREQYTDSGVPKYRDRRSGSPAPSAGVVRPHVAGRDPRRGVSGVVARLRDEGHYVTSGRTRKASRAFTSLSRVPERRGRRRPEEC
jgi:hypothetical protein